MRIIFNGLIGTASKRCLTTGKNRLRFDGRTAIITGAGRGLGREYALLLASRGANLLINDFNGDRDGRPEETPENAAEKVAEEIRERWPEAQVAINCESIINSDNARRIVETALDKFGRVDILINNAGILRDKSFGKMSLDDWDHVQAVHLRGSFLMSKACWSQMRKREYGRIVMTSSTSGLFGNFGQANYSAAKMGLVGLGNTLAIEGKRNNILCNTVVPMASSRMTYDLLPEDIAAKLHPAHVAPLVAWLCHESCTETGGLFEAAGGWYGKYRLQRSEGQLLSDLQESNGDSIERISENWRKICQFDVASAHIESSHDHLQQLLRDISDNSDSRE